MGGKEQGEVRYGQAVTGPSTVTVLILQYPSAGSDSLSRHCVKRYKIEGKSCIKIEKTTTLRLSINLLSIMY